MACLANEKIPEMTACEAITVANVASKIKGHNQALGARLKKVEPVGADRVSRYAPCPK
ncbi:Uncharacterised protein [Vibrio cholerae]|nr:Uncharacterised protein [Vibrio cholerae]